MRVGGDKFGHEDGERAIAILRLERGLIAGVAFPVQHRLDRLDRNMPPVKPPAEVFKGFVPIEPVLERVFVRNRGKPPAGFQLLESRFGASTDRESKGAANNGCEYDYSEQWDAPLAFQQNGGTVIASDK